MTNEQLFIRRAETQCRIAEVTGRNTGRESYMLPLFKGEPEVLNESVMDAEFLPDVFAYAREVLANPAAIAACEEWNALVSPDKDALRYVRQLAAGEMPR